MNIKRNTWTTILLLLVLAACEPAADRGPAPAREFSSVDTVVSSRGVPVPVTYVHPLTTSDEKFPLVVLAHGHGGTRNEAGGFTGVAEGLAARGIASIRMDFPGCGDSVETFVNNNIDNMRQDIAAARDFALVQPNIDHERVGILGFSMGGRLAILTAAADDSYKVVATWAPAATNGAGSMAEFLGGPEAYREAKAQAAREGFVPFTTPWGQDQQLGLQFFTDLEQSRPLDAAGRIRAPLLVLYGDQDTVVRPEVADALIEAATNSSEVQRHVIEGADHGLGLYSDEPQYSREAIDATVAFFAERL